MVKWIRCYLDSVEKVKEKRVLRLGIINLKSLYLWADNEVPGLCPVRCFLFYIWLTGIKEGYVFPKSELLGVAHSNLNTTDQHKTYLSDCIEVFERVTGNIGVYGGHTGMYF